MSSSRRKKYNDDGNGMYFLIFVSVISIAQNAAFFKKPASCNVASVNHCDLAASSSGQASGVCASGYSGSCTFNCFRGIWSIDTNNCVSAEFVFNATISSNTANYNLKSAAISAGWDQVQKLNASITINAGVTVYSTSTAIAAFETGMTFPAGSSLTLVNNGSIVGMGGAGGAGAVVTSGCGNAVAGAPGGPALKADLSATVSNNGAINGGGGGGGGGGSARSSARAGVYCAGGSGGGGGQGFSASAGGAGGSASGGTSNVSGNAGGTGGSSGPGSGGPGVVATAPRGGDGGSGGAYGSSGASGSAGSNANTCSTGGGSGGAGGAAVIGNSNITWSVTGVRNGAIN